MVQVETIAVLLGLELGRHPLTGVDPKLRASERLAILSPADVLAVCVLLFHPIVLPIVGNVEDFVEECVGLSLARAGVLFRE